MTKTMKSVECGVPANKVATKPTAASQTGIKRIPTKMSSSPKNAAGSKAAARPAKTVDVTSAQLATVNLAIEAETAPAKPKTTKQEQVLTLLSQAGGATIDEIMTATGWQQHSVRGFFAGTVRKKLGFELTSQKREGSERRYAIKVAA